MRRRVSDMPRRTRNCSRQGRHESTDRISGSDRSGAGAPKTAMTARCNSLLDGARRVIRTVRGWASTGTASPTCRSTPCAAEGARHSQPCARRAGGLAPIVALPPRPRRESGLDPQRPNSKLSSPTSSATWRSSAPHSPRVPRMRRLSCQPQPPVHTIAVLRRQGRSTGMP